MNCSQTLYVITNSSKTSCLTKDEQILLWNISVGVSVFCSVLGLYFTITVTVFICKQSPNEMSQWAPKSSKEFNQRGRTLTSDISVGSTSIYRKSTLKKSRANKKLANFKKLLHYILFLVMLLILLRALEEATLLHFGNASNTMCDVFSKIWIVWTALVIFSCHSFLWVKQQAIFSNPILKEIRTRFFHYLSCVTLVFMVLVLVGCSVTLILWSNYHVVDGICQPDIGSQQFSLALSFGITSGLTAIIQFFVSFLFVYPIVYNNRKLKSHEARKDAKKSWSLFGKKSESLNETVKRTLLCSTITITTDFLEAAIAMLFPPNIPCAVVAAAYHLNVVLNAVCLFCTYSEWRKFFVPCLQNKRKAITTGSFKERDRPILLGILDVSK